MPAPLPEGWKRGHPASAPIRSATQAIQPASSGIEVSRPSEHAISSCRSATGRPSARCCAALITSMSLCHAAAKLGRPRQDEPASRSSPIWKAFATSIDASTDLEMAKRIIVNARCRTGVCGAAETLLVDRAVASAHLRPLLAALSNAGCEIRGSAEVLETAPTLKAATEDDWSTEYLDAIISVTLVDGISGAIAHIGKYSSNHTEAVIAENPEVVERFFKEVDSAILLHNASTQFADGGEFGMGAEIGIATGKMHARGPVGVEQLTSFKYRVRGNGQIRP